MLPPIFPLPLPLPKPFRYDFPALPCTIRTLSLPRKTIPPKILFFFLRLLHTTNPLHPPILQNSPHITPTCFSAIECTFHGMQNQLLTGLIYPMKEFSAYISTGNAEIILEIYNRFFCWNRIVLFFLIFFSFNSSARFSGPKVVHTLVRYLVH